MNKRNDQNQGITRAGQLPSQSQYETGWVTRRIPLGEEVHALTYHEELDAYVLGTSTIVDFKLPEDEFHSQWTAEGIHTMHTLRNSTQPWLTGLETTFLPQAEQGSIKLLDHKSLSIIDK